MQGMWIQTNTFSHAVATAEHKIITFEVELLDSLGHQGQVVAVLFFYKGQVLQKGRVDAHRFDERGNFVRYVEQCEKVGVGEKLAKNFKTLFPAPHPGQPIVNNCYLH